MTVTDIASSTNVGLKNHTQTVPVDTMQKVDTNNSPLIYILEDDALMAECLARSCRNAFMSSTAASVTSISTSPTVKVFADAISAVAELDVCVPDLILLDVMLNGPDGFTFLNELMSYSDTAKIPVILITSMELRVRNLEHYGVREIIAKETMTPASLAVVVRRYV